MFGALRQTCLNFLFPSAVVFSKIVPNLHSLYVYEIAPLMFPCGTARKCESCMFLQCTTDRSNFSRQSISLYFSTLPRDFLHAHLNVRGTWPEKDALQISKSCILRLFVCYEQVLQNFTNVKTIAKLMCGLLVNNNFSGAHEGWCIANGSFFAPMSGVGGRRNRNRPHHVDLSWST